MLIEVDVFATGGKGDGGSGAPPNDYDHEAITKAWDQVESEAPSWKMLGFDQLQLGGGVVRFPTPKNFASPAGQSSEVYVVSKSLKVPANRNLAFVGTAPQAITIRMVNQDPADPDYGYAFVVPAGDGAITFERIAFFGAGVRIDGPRRAPVVFRDCTFTDCPLWCIRSDDGPTVENVRVTRCVFHGNGPVDAKGWDGGVIGIGNASAGWRIEHSVFLYFPGDGVRIAGSRCVVDRCRFEAFLAKGDMPYPSSGHGIHVMAGSKGGVRITRCKLGAEPYPPRDFALVGPGAAETSPKMTIGPQLTQCLFQGPADYQGGAGGKGDGLPDVPIGANVDAVCRSILLLSAPVAGLQVRDCAIWHYNTLILEPGASTISEPWPAVLPAGAPDWKLDKDVPTAACRDNALLDVFFHEDTFSWKLGFVQAFSNGGRGFEVSGRRLTEQERRSSPVWRRCGNLLGSATTALPGPQGPWVPANTTAALAISTIDAGPVWLLAPVPNGLTQSWVAHPLAPYVLQAFRPGPLVLSAWLRAVDNTPAGVRLEIRGYGAGAGSAVRAFLVDSTWRRYSVVAESPGPEVVAVLRLGLSDVSDPGAKSVYVYGPQLESGTEPTAFVPGQAPPHVPRASQSQLLGEHTMARDVSDPMVLDQSVARMMTKVAQPKVPSSFGAQQFPPPAWAGTASPKWTWRAGDRILTTVPAKGLALWKVFDGIGWRDVTRIGID